MPPAHSGAGFVVFSLAMLIGRLNGDKIITAFGDKTVLTIGAIIGSAGVALGVGAPSVPLSILGFAMIGGGCANIVPLLFSMTGRQTVMPPHLAIAAISVLGYAGLLMGPPGIGFVAHATSLPTAYCGIALALLTVSVAGRAVIARSNPSVSLQVESS